MHDEIETKTYTIHIWYDDTGTKTKVIMKKIEIHMITRDNDNRGHRLWMKWTHFMDKIRKHTLWWDRNKEIDELIPELETGYVRKTPCPSSPLNADTNPHQPNNSWLHPSFLN